ncbi:MAG: hypothetical protein WC356_02115 [Candidatus Micrarchaeia archaeon]|jgi:hypothetical protein
MTAKEKIIEQNKITNAVDDFADEMKNRMLAKYDEGKRDWDSCDNACSEDCFKRKLQRNVEEKDWVDVANFSMILHNAEKK